MLANFAGDMSEIWTHGLSEKIQGQGQRAPSEVAKVYAYVIKVDPSHRLPADACPDGLMLWTDGRNDNIAQERCKEIIEYYDDNGGVLSFDEGFGPWEVLGEAIALPIDAANWQGRCIKHKHAGVTVLTDKS